MTEAWPEERAFRSALRELSTSASKITAAARLALHDGSHAKAVVAALEKHAREGPPSQKLPVLYVINQICRNSTQKLGSSEPFTGAFAPRIGEIVRHALSDCPAADQSAAKRTVRLWVESKFFSADALAGASVGAPVPPEPKTPPGPPPPLTSSASSHYLTAHAIPSAPPVVHIPAPYYGNSASLYNAGVSHSAPSAFPAVPLYPQAALAGASAWGGAPAASSYQSQFDYGDEQDEEERLAEQKRRRLEEERRVNEGSPPRLTPLPTSSQPLPKDTSNHSHSLPPSNHSPVPSSVPGTYPPYYQQSQLQLQPQHQLQKPPQAAAPPVLAGAPVKASDAATTYHSLTLFVGRLPPGVPRDELQRLFEQFGRVTRAVVLNGKDHGFVSFSTRQEAEAARRGLDGVPFMTGAPPMRIGWGREGVPPHLAPFFDNNSGVAIEGQMPQTRRPAGTMQMGGGGGGGGGSGGMPSGMGVGMGGVSYQNMQQHAPQAQFPQVPIGGGVQNNMHSMHMQQQWPAYDGTQ